MERQSAMHAELAVVRFRDYARWLVGSAIVLTVLFSANQAVRRGASAWTTGLALNGLDWLAWGLIVPAIVVIGQRARIGVSSSRAASVAVWIAMGIVSVFGISIVTALVIHRWPQIFFGPGTPGPAGDLVPFLVNWVASNYGFNAIIFGAIAGVLHASLYHRDLQARRLRQAELESQLTKSELTVLRMQLQPHFLFNALHTVSSLMITDVAAAQSVIAALGTLLRTSLDHTGRQEIPLGEELSFVELYVQVQRARFGERLIVHVDIDDELRNALVPGLVLQPLVENAIRHGLEPSAEGGAVWVSARRVGNSLELSVRDDSRAPDTRPPSVLHAAPTSTGIGLSNLGARLTQLYGPSSRFTAERVARGGFAVTLTIPYHVNEGLFPSQHTAP